MRVWRKAEPRDLTPRAGDSGEKRLVERAFGIGRSALAEAAQMLNQQMLISA